MTNETHKLSDAEVNSVNCLESRDLSDHELELVTGGSSARDYFCTEAAYYKDKAKNDFLNGNFGAGLKDAMESAKAKTGCH